MPKAKGWGVEVLNLDEAVNAFKGAEQAFGATPLKECLMPIAYRVRDAAKRLVRYSNEKKNPGYLHLKDAIFAAWGKPDHPSAIVGVDRKKAPHAHLVEFGHGGPHPAGPHPYLRPALDTIRSAAMALMGVEIQNRILKHLTVKRGGMMTPEQYGVYSKLVPTHGEQYARWAATRKRP